MNGNRLEGHWKQFKGSAKMPWDTFTHRSLEVNADKHPGTTQNYAGASKVKAERKPLTR